MSTAASSSLQNIDFSRLVLQERVTRAPYGIAIYPLTNLGVSVSINVTTSAINLRYNTGAVTTISLSYVGKTVEDIVAEINSQILPVRAIALTTGVRLETGDLFLYNTSGYFAVPNGFRYYDRLSSNGVVIRCNKYTVQHKALANFRVLSPYNSSVLLPWYPLISNGQFIQRYQEKIYHYAIPEYSNQQWSIRYGKPFKDVFGASLTRISNNSFKLPRAPVYWTGDNFSIFNGDVPVSNTIIEDVDIKNGIIYVSDSNFINENTSINYSHLENNYEYKGININAHFSQNPNLLDKYVILYAVPVDGISYNKTKQTIKHVVASSVEDAISKIQIIDSNSPFVIIGGYNISQVTTSDRVQILDTRSLGGGLISSEGPINPIKKSFYGLTTLKEKSREIEESYNQGTKFWDIGNWDGEIYPGAAAISVGIPDSLKQKMPREDVESRAFKFIAAGVYTIVDYYKDELPAVTGTSTQISLVLNSSLLEHIGGVSGVCWHRDGVELPGSNITGSWPEEFGQLEATYKIDNTGVIATKPDYTIYQSYLKSTPTAGIEYRTREVIYVSGASSELTELGQWKKVVLEDSRPVPEGWVTKGYVEFPKSSNSIEVRSLKVNSPYRLDHTGTFGDSLLYEIKNIASGVLDRTSSSQINSVIGNTIDISPITLKRSSVIDEEYSPYNPYFGAGEGYNFLFELYNSNLYSGFKDLFVKVGDQVASSFTGIDNKYYPMAYDTEGAGYQAFSSGYITGLDVRSVFEQSCRYAFWRRVVSGESDQTYVNLRQRLINLSTNLNKHTDGYLPKLYTLDAATTSPTFVAESQTVPQYFGYGNAEISDEYSRDNEFLYMNPAAFAATLLVSDYNAVDAVPVVLFTRNAMQGAAKALERFANALTGTRTFTGLPVVQSWYMPYNRYGTYLGSMSRQFISSYEYLMESHHYATNVPVSGFSGIDVTALDWHFSGIEYMLDIAYPHVAATVMRNGILEPEIADTLYSYGWYVANVHHHFEHLDAVAATVHSHGSHSNDPSSHPLLGKFSGLFTTGLYTLLKGMVSRNSSIYEIPIVNGEHGPYAPKVPSKIFDALAIGCKIDKEKYLPLTQAIFNTVTGNYSVNGLYWTDPTKTSESAGQEDIMSPYFVRLLKEL